MARRRESDEIIEYLSVIDKIRDDSDIHKFIQELAYRGYLNYEPEAETIYRPSAETNWKTAKRDLASWAMDNGMKATNLEDSINSRIQEEEIRVNGGDGSDKTSAIKSLADEIEKEYIKLQPGSYQGQYL